MREMEEERNHLQENLAYFRYLLLIIIIHLVARGMSKHNHSRSFVFFHNCNFYPKPCTVWRPKVLSTLWNHIFRRSIAFTFNKKPKTGAFYSLNERFGSVGAWIKPKRLFRLNKSSTVAVGFFNKFKSFNYSTVKMMDSAQPLWDLQPG